MEVACGQCLGCRLDHRRLWAMRCLHESLMHERAGLDTCFVTLTYRSELECTPTQRKEGLHVPSDWSIHKSHFQKFMKRLRKNFPQKIKYYGVGEYGNICKHGGWTNVPVEYVPRCSECKLGRPHYHALLFNVAFADAEMVIPGHERSGWTSRTLEDIWKYGHVQIGELNSATAAYCAGYVTKKVNGLQANEHYEAWDEEGNRIWLTPESAWMSRGRRCENHVGDPVGALDCQDCTTAIGASWFHRYVSDVFPSDEVPLPGTGRVVRGVPRYYEELFKRTDPLTLEQVKELRQKFMAEHKDEYTPQRLMDKYKVAKARCALFEERKL